MQRRFFIAGNWKMNLNREQAMALAQGIANGMSPTEAEVAVFPPYPYLDAVRSVLDGGSVLWGAQDMYHQGDGAYTGEVSAPMLQDLGCRYVILGHSERRHVLGESNELIGEKVAVAIAAGLPPILCVGETLSQREEGKTQQVVFEQLEAGLAGVDSQNIGQLGIAYEPVWAIGTGKTASPEQAQQVHADLRDWLDGRYNTEIAAGIRIQYGGSVKPANAAELLAQEDIDGALVGGASLQLDSFLAIISAAGLA